MQLKKNTKPRAEGPWPSAGKNTGRLEMPERMTRDVVEQIKVADDLDAHKREAAEREAAGKCRGAAGRQPIPAWSASALACGWDHW